MCVFLLHIHFISTVSLFIFNEVSLHLLCAHIKLKSLLSFHGFANLFYVYSHYTPGFSFAVEEGDSSSRKSNPNCVPLLLSKLKRTGAQMQWCFPLTHKIKTNEKCAWNDAIDFLIVLHYLVKSYIFDSLQCTIKAHCFEMFISNNSNSCFWNVSFLFNPE